MQPRLAVAFMDDPRDRGWRSYAAKLSVSAATIVLLAAVFAVIEILLRLFVPTEGTTYDRSQLEYFAWAAEPPYKVEQSPAGSMLVKQSLPNQPTIVRNEKLLPTSLPLEKTPAKIRLMIVGESSAAMMEYRLAEVLSQIDCDSHFEMLQCAVAGGDLPQTLRRFDQCLGYNPDVVIVIFGHNLYFHNLSDPAVIRRERIRAMSRLLSLLALPRPVSLLPGDPEQKRRELDEGLRHMADAARSRDIRLIVTTMGSNLWHRPVADLGDATDTDYLATLFQHDSGNLERAIADLSRLVDRKPIAIYHFDLGDWLYDHGDYDAARRHLEAARDLDPGRIRASSAVNDLIRKDGEALPYLVRDTERDLISSSAHGIPGWDSFIDNCHLLASNIREPLALASLAAPRGAAAECIAQHPLAEVSKSINPTFRSVAADLRQSLTSVLDQANAEAGINRRLWTATLPYLIESAFARDPSAAQEEIERAFSAAELDKLKPNVAGYAILGLAEGLDRAGQTDLARLRIEQAKKGPVAAEAWLLAGRIELRRGDRAAARDSIAAALQRDPQLAVARYFHDHLVGAPSGASNDQRM